jgi:hypothetical protein
MVSYNSTLDIIDKIFFTFSSMKLGTYKLDL